MTIATRWAAVRADVDAACVRASRDPSSVTIVAVAKTHPASAIREVVAAGALDIGENYAQELVAKRAELAIDQIRWHFVGRLQRNKAKLVAGQVALVHAVDGPDLATELAKRRAAPELLASAAPQRVLLSVNVAGEVSKGGVALADAPAVARAIASIHGVSLDGLMTMPPPSPDDDPEAGRPAFTALAQLRDRLRDDLSLPLPVLSMGMSGDFAVAIACGATHVRIGTAIFGARPSA
ncbi:MAG: YggS family pyridoxal phosphate-dependent enzyme [Kofleriaceae bacterium]